MTFLLLLFSGVICDIPTHCELSSLAGLWKFTFIQNPKDPKCISTKSFSSTLEQVSQLGLISPHPSRDPLSPLVTTSSTVLSFDVNLSSSFRPGHGFLLTASPQTDPDNSEEAVQGFWSPVFDQGIMLKNFSVGHGALRTAYRIAMAYSAFECRESDVVCRSARDLSIRRDGSPPFPFKSKCSATLIGWAVTSGSQTHCFRGQRVKGEMVQDLSCPSTSASSTSITSTRSFTDPVSEWLRYKFPPADQKNCGSCYVHASLFALRASLLKAAAQAIQSSDSGKEVSQYLNEHGTLMLKNADLGKDSAESSFLASFTNQECQGGHPLFLGVGLLSQGHNVAFDFLSGRYYPACVDVAAMEKHLREVGPLVVAVDVPSHEALSPDSSNPRAVVVTVGKKENARVIVKLEHDRNKKEYEFANHAMVIVGYGEGVTASNDKIAFWEVRNSWGPGWGEGGYVKIKKGVNLGGIEGHVMSIHYSPPKTSRRR